MSTQKPTPETSPEADQPADLALDAETVKDLDPGSKASDDARGGANYTRMGGTPSVNL